MGVTLPLFRKTPRSVGERRTISVLGATGSIGDSTAQVLMAHPDKFDVVALVGGSNAQRMAELARALKPKTIAMQSKAAAQQLAIDLSREVHSGPEAVLGAAAEPADISVCAITGFAGLRPTLAAINAGNDIALANKESMVCAGPFVIEAAKQAGVDVLPVDSEHSALFQCLIGQDLQAVKSVVLTASGGPFRALSPSELNHVTVDQALAHPNWSMGSKVTIDSSTLMNKGLEVIEAKWLFDVDPNELSAVIHPQSIVHSLIHFHDGSMVAQMGVPSMVTPISLALGWPCRLDMSDNACAQEVLEPTVALTRWSGLGFEQIDKDRFPCFDLALGALSEGLEATIALNAANEVAVEDFLCGRIGYGDIAKKVDETLQKLDGSGVGQVSALEHVFALDAWARAVGRGD